MKQWNAYHFVGETLRDGRPIPADGEALIHAGEIKMCKTGLHASRKPWQAFEFTPGHTLCRVYCDGIEFEDNEKLVCRKRTIVSRIDTEKLIWDFARSCALDVVHLWNAPDVVIEYLKTGDEVLKADAHRAIRATAARYNTSTTAVDTAWYAARTAAIAVDAARYAARYAAMYAATAAAGAGADVRRKQRTRFTKMVNRAFDEVIQND